MLLCDIAITELHTNLDRPGNTINLASKALARACPHVIEPGIRWCPVACAFEVRELERRIPLNRELIVRNRVNDLMQLSSERRLIDGLELGAILFANTTADHAQRGGQRHLEAGAGRHHPLMLESREHLPRLERGLGIPEGPQFKVFGPHTLFNPSRAKVDATNEHRFVAHSSDAGSLREAVWLKRNPVPPLPHLPIGNPLEMPAEPFGSERGCVRAACRVTW